MPKISVKLNPDVTPAGSDLAIVNAARRSFNTRSNWDKVILSHQEFEENESKYSDWQLVDSFYEPYSGYELRKLKDKDKRLLEFLARGMTADDFEQFVHSVPAADTEEHRKELVDMLWQWRNTPTHDTPFNHTFISFEVKAPIFVRAQLVKHEYLIMSEFSRRYITDQVEFYQPDYWRAFAPNKKQGSTNELVTFLRMRGFGEQSIDDGVFKHQMYSFDLFNDMITAGVAPEQARMVLPQNTMTEWTWSGTLGAFAKMCTLRLHPEAQYEARKVAEQVYSHLKEYYPVAAPALVEGVL